MPENNNSTPEKTPDSYELLIEKINKMEEIIATQNKKIEDVTKMNRALLNGNTEKSPEKGSDKKELEEKLYKGIRR